MLPFVREMQIEPVVLLVGNHVEEPAILELINNADLTVRLTDDRPGPLLAAGLRVLIEVDLEFRCVDVCDPDLWVGVASLRAAAGDRGEVLVELREAMEHPA